MSENSEPGSITPVTEEEWSALKAAAFRRTEEPDYIPPSAQPVWLSSLEVADMIIRVGKPLDDGKAVAFDMLLALNDLVLAKRKGASHDR